MSSSLRWEPVERDAKPAGGSDLKFALRKRFGEPVDIILNGRAIPWLEGVRDAATSKDLATDAGRLIGLIEKHGSIRVFESW